MLAVIIAVLATGLTSPAQAACGIHRNDDNLRLPDAGPPVTSSITVTGCPGNAPAELKVAVVVKHPYRGDVRIDLVGPSGREYRLKNSNSVDGKDDIDETFAAATAREPANGRWSLKLQDRSEADVGHLDRWSINLG